MLENKPLLKKGARFVLKNQGGTTITLDYDPDYKPEKPVKKSLSSFIDELMQAGYQPDEKTTCYIEQLKALGK